MANRRRFDNNRGRPRAGLTSLQFDRVHAGEGSQQPPREGQPGGRDDNRGRGYNRSGRGPSEGRSHTSSGAGRDSRLPNRSAMAERTPPQFHRVHAREGSQQPPRQGQPGGSPRHQPVSVPPAPTKPPPCTSFRDAVASGIPRSSLPSRFVSISSIGNALATPRPNSAPSATSSTSSSRASAVTGRDVANQYPSDPQPPRPPPSLPDHTIPLTPSLSQQTATTSDRKAPGDNTASLPPRPGSGKQGKKVQVFTNHFAVSFDVTQPIYQYFVKIKPTQATSKDERLPKPVCRLIFTKLIEKENLNFGSFAYDGNEVLYTSLVPFDSNDFVIPWSDGRRRERDFTVSITKPKERNLQHLKDFLEGHGSGTVQDIIQALDVVLRKWPTEQYTTVGRYFFSSEFGRKPMGAGLEGWAGFCQSLRPTQNGLSLNIDVSATAFYEDIAIDEFVGRKFLGRFTRDEESLWTADTRNKLITNLKGVNVLAGTTSTRRRHKITGISSTPANKLMFLEQKGGQEKSVEQYFKDKHGYSLTKPAWPCLQAGSANRPIYLPMEVCKIVPGQRYSRNLDVDQLSKLSGLTGQGPGRRKSSIETVRKGFSVDYARSFNVTIGDDFTSCEARELDKPEEKGYRERKMFDPQGVGSWSCVNLSNDKSPHEVGSFCNVLIEKCKNLGMAFRPNSKIAVSDFMTTEEKLRAIAASPRVKEKHFVIIILPKDNDYGRIKKICEIDLGLVSQCCLDSKINSPTNKYLENLALKINAKLGGKNVVLRHLSRQMNHETTIIFGADVTHPPAGVSGFPSIAAVVASMDWPDVATYRASLSSQNSGTEMIKDLEQMTRDLLNSFKESTKTWPRRMIFYRDGVSEGQFKEVIAEEIKAIREACLSLGNCEHTIKITFVVVQKRHHTRFFSPPLKNPSNVKAGTVVDTTICHPREHDFYLCSHYGSKGTSRPTHYHVLCDENNLTADNLQTLTYDLCFTSARSKSSISVVTPVQYAHLAAYRARCYLQTDPSAQSKDTVQPVPPIHDNVKKLMFFC